MGWRCSKDRTPSMKRNSECLGPLWLCGPLDLGGTEKPSGSPLALLRRVAEASVDEQVRERAAACFNDHIKYRWRSWPDPFPLPAAEKDPIKTLIVPLVLSSANPTIHAHLRQALAIIGSHDFPRHWPALLPDLTSRLETAIEADDFASVNRVLDTLNSLLEKFCCNGKGPEPLRLDLKHCFDNFCDPLLKTVQIISGKINAAASNAGFEVVSKLSLLIEAQLLCFEMFYSLNFIDLPGFFVKPVDKWMDEFKNYLTVTDQLNELQSAVFENIGLYVKKTDQPFQDYFRPFVEEAVVVLLDDAKPLTVAAIKFLTLVGTSSHYNRLFSQDHVLRQITDKVVVRNMALSDDDEEVFRKDYIEFIRRDMDPKSRRMVTCQLLKAIARRSGLGRVSAMIRNLLALFAENPTTNWKYKDCAISLVLSFKTHPTPVVDFVSFFRSVIMPELQSRDVNSFPILKAGALKFFTKFWFRMPDMGLVGDVVRLLGSDANVVHSYAAIFIKKRLLLSDKRKRSPFARILPVLSKNLFEALKKRGSEENKYVMDCIVHFGTISESPCIVSATSVVISGFCENRKYPDRLFEAFDYLVTRSDLDWVSLVPALDVWILPSVRMMLDRHATEFFPYALWLFSRLMDYDTFKVPPPYKRLILDILNMLIVEALLDKNHMC
ncbi:hypothetical protein OSB04_004730 [Centaurea solstitialis]|uniref:Importin N-terminal domain-containing protein n=1 Tax=Centaurea solstitialis TaxID=347529 RepID=A0AA38TRA6_9ASTR|nr:hypothetical protein OSB04_004730 [Centaurea solstitialis]